MLIPLLFVIQVALCSTGHIAEAGDPASLQVNTAPAPDQCAMDATKLLPPDINESILRRQWRTDTVTSTEGPHLDRINTGRNDGSFSGLGCTRKNRMLIPLLFVIQVALCSTGHIAEAGDPASLQVNTAPAPDQCAMDATKLLPPDINESILRRQWRTDTVTSTEGPHLDRINTGRNDGSFSGLGCTRKDRMLIPLLFVIQVALCSTGHIAEAGDPASLQVNTAPAPDQCAMDATKLLPPDINESILRRQWRTDTVTSTEGPHLDRINTGRNDGSFSGLGCTRKDRMLIPLLFVIQVALCSTGHIAEAGDPASLQVNTAPAPDQCAMDATKLLPPDINESILRRQWRTDTVTSTEGPHLDRINTGRNDGSFSGLGCTRKNRMLIPLLFVIQVALCSTGHIAEAGDPASLQVNTAPAPDQCAMDTTKLLPPDINESILRRQWRTDTVTSTEGPHLDLQSYAVLIPRFDYIGHYVLKPRLYAFYRLNPRLLGEESEEP
ncbi:hypothetical protein MRX96_038528 [Rhipicephalus microplus]